MGVDLIVFGFSSVDRFHAEGVAEDEWNVLFNTEIGDPVPGEHAFYRNHDVLTEGSSDVEKNFRVCVGILMNPDIASGVNNTYKHSLGM